MRFDGVKQFGVLVYVLVVQVVLGLDLTCELVSLLLPLDGVMLLLAAYRLVGQVVRHVLRVRSVL